MAPFGLILGRILPTVSGKPLECTLGHQGPQGAQGGPAPLGPWRILAAGAIAAAGPDSEADGPDFEAAGPDFQAGPGGPDSTNGPDGPESTDGPNGI